MNPFKPIYQLLHTVLRIKAFLKFTKFSVLYIYSLKNLFDQSREIQLSKDDISEATDV